MSSADDRIRINFNQTLRDFDDKETVALGLDPHTISTFMQAINVARIPTDAQARLIKEMDAAGVRPLKLGEACILALRGAFDDEKELDEKTRLDRFQLQMRIHTRMKKDGWARIRTTERDEIKKVVYKKFPGSFVAPYIDLLLEGKALSFGDDEPEEQTEATGPAADSSPVSDTPTN